LTEISTPDRLAGLSREQRALLFERLRRKKEQAAAETRIPRRDPGSSVVPLSFAQERLWFLHRLQPASAAYNMPLALVVHGALDAAALEAALNEVARRHEALRTVFWETDPQPVQVILPAERRPLPRVDLSALPAAVRAAAARQLAFEEGQRPFDLERGPLLRATLLRCGPREHGLLLNMHHIVSDGWSMGVLVREIGVLYGAAREAVPPPLPELPIQYADFAVWQRQWLTGEELARQLAYWPERLAGAPTSIDLPRDRPRPPVQSFRGARTSFAYGAPLTAGLRALARRRDATLFMVLLAGFEVLLGRYSGQDDLLIGSPIANRNRYEIAPLIGFFVNTLVLRADLAGDPTFEEFLERVKRTSLDAYSHQDLPFERLVEELRPERHLSHNPLFQVMFALQNAPAGEADFPGLSLAPLQFDLPEALFDLELNFGEMGDALALMVTCADGIFEPATVRRLVDQLERLLAAAAAAPAKRLSELPLLAAAERHQLLREWNDAGEPASGTAVVDGFAAVARRTPDAAAIVAGVAGGEVVSYAALNRRANRLAHRLRRLGVGPGVAVGLCAERSAAMVAGLLGIWKAGGAYVPLDPALPPARLAFLLADSGVPLVVSEQSAVAALPAGPACPVLVDGPELAAECDGDPEPLGEPQDLAYLIYTSGTTGQPKAVMVERRQLASTLAATGRLFGFGPGDWMPCVAPFSFDIFLFELLSPLLAGGVSQLVPLRPALDVEALADTLGRATLLHAVPALMRQVVETVRRRRDRPRRLRALFVGGDVVPAELVVDLRQTFPAACLWILYGPTEAAILATAHPVPAAGPLRPLLGRPLAGVTIDLRDAGGRLVPVGARGEIWIGGAGVARGYLGRDELTAEKLVDRDGRRFFRSGDLARRLPDGGLEFLGRLDDQVKVRGFRIELGEVESALARHPRVSAAVAAVRAGDDDPAGKRLVAYVVPRETGEEAGGGPAAAEHVAQWQTLYDETYGRSPADGEAAFNLQGWNSSYTGEPIPAEEMREWVDSTVERLLALDHRRVLEVGCGTGLLLFRVAPEAERYVGTDFSSVALDLVRREAVRRGLAQVELARRTADDWTGVEPGAFDLVILNSVVQYFPGVDYVLRVLAGAVRAVRPGGAVWIGDVRSLPLLPALHESVERFRTGDSLAAEELQRRVRRRVAEEEELVLDPGLFRALEGRLAVRRAEILQKRGRYQNELTRFRYDVVLHVGPGDAAAGAEPAAPASGERPWRSYANDPLRTRLARALVPELRRALQAELPEYMVPAAFVLLDDLPLTAHGKVDRAALPAPEPPRAAGVTPPRSAAEIALAAIWRELLGVEQVGVDDNFFELGGHSLLATQLVSRVRAACNLDLPLRTVFESPTLGGLAAALASQGSTEDDAELRREPAAEAPLSFSQERLWFLDRLLPGSAVYNIPSPLRLRGPLDPGVLARALTGIVSRHEALRTRFANRGGTPAQVIDPPAPVSLPRIDLASLPVPMRQPEAGRITAEEASLPFDLERGPVIRFALLRLDGWDSSEGEEEHVLLMTVHHIVSDGWSVGVLYRELTQLYEAFSRGRPSPLPPLPMQYADFARWQRGWLSGPRLESQLAYWRERLAGRPQGLDLPRDRPRPTVQTFRGGSASLRLARSLTERLKSLRLAERASDFMILLAGFAVLLQRLSGQDDVLVGAPVAGRTRPEVEGLIGFFLNTLVLRTDLAGRPTFRELVGRVRAAALGAYAHQDVPFERLLADLQPERDLSRTPLFEVFFNMLNLPPSRAKLPGGVDVEPLGFGELEAKFDLTVYALEAEDGFVFNFVYNADLFARARVEEMLRQYRSLLSQAAAEPDRPIHLLSLLTPEAAAVLPDPTAPLDEASPGLVHELFAARAARHPERPAVVDAEGTWTYGELQAAAGRLAAWLRAAGLGPGDCVALHAHRSAPLVWAVFGVLEAGAAFVILDPAYPPARLAAMVDLARPRGWLEIAAAGPPGAELEERLQSLAAAGRLVRRLALPGGGPAGARELLAALPAAPPAVSERPALGPDDVALIAFTSGSTGAPKGILGRHGPLSHFLPWQCERFGLTAADRYSLLSGLSHDPLQRDIFTPLCTGATLCAPPPEEMGAPGRLAAWMARAGITVAHLTPALGQVLTEPPGGGVELPQVPSLRWVLLVGDVLTRLDVDRLRGIAPGVTCVNLYGSTETQRAVGYHVVAPDGTDGAHRVQQVLPLGRGMQDVQLLVLSPAGQLAGIGEVGEICVRSPHLARGYLGDEALTRERFVRNPFTGQPGDRMYRTGDLGRYLPNGEAAFAGRADGQVKIRGFRIELGEIEAVLGRLPGVREAVVVARESPRSPGDRRLAAYVVPDPDSPPDPEALQAALRGLLPAYMIPSAWVVLERLPLLPNGKVDRRALPEPGEDRQRAYLPPSTVTEETLAEIWRALLDRERISAGDDFFLLGGHSLLATRVAARARDAFGIELPLPVLFQETTLAGLAAWIDRERAARSGPALAKIQPRRRAEGFTAGLSPQQRGMWLAAQMSPESPAYVIALSLRLSGRLDRGALRRALAEVVRRHEALRVRFIVVAGEPRQVLGPAVDVPLPRVDLRALPSPARAAAVRWLAGQDGSRPFDLARGPLLRAALLQTAADEHALLFAMHHLVSDAWSMGVLVREVTSLYAAFSAGGPSPLPELPIQYLDYVEWQREHLSAEVLAGQLAWWRERLADAPDLELPSDRRRPEAGAFRGAAQPMAPSSMAMADFHRLCRRHGATPFMVLLAVFETLLHRYTGQDDLVVGSAIANRRLSEIEDLIGLFVNTLALRLDCAGDPPFGELLARIRSEMVEAYARQDLPFERLVAELGTRRDRGGSPPFRAFFQVQNTPLPDGLELSDLTLSGMELERQAAELDLALTARDTPEGVDGEWRYSTALFDPATVARMAVHFSLLLAGAVADEGRRLSELPLLTGGEAQQLLSEWNDTRDGATAAAPLALFAALAAARPDAVAVVERDQRLTYGELSRRADALARRLRRLGVEPEVPVGVLLPRSAELVLAMVAVAKAGGVYLPLDPAHPEERIAGVFADAGVGVVLAAGPPGAAAASGGRTLVVLDGREEREELAGGRPVAPGGEAANLAYAVFTSGSTGRPKGVAVERRSVANLFAWHRRALGFTAADHDSLLFGPAFDGSIMEIWAPLSCGATLHVADEDARLSPGALAAWAAREGITVLSLPTPIANAFLAEPLPPLPAVRLLSAGGDRLARPLGGDLGFVLANLYGPTETTVLAAGEPRVLRTDREPAIGRPLRNARAYVLDDRLRPVPLGAAGELFVGGEILARGYLGRPDLTAAAFLPDPFSPVPGARAYRTGDRVRHLPDGRLEILGRRDHQVKLRGVRIELGEIESVLREHPEVRDAAVVLRPDPGGNARLVAYTVRTRTDRTDLSDPADLRAFLKKRLPESMVPAFFVRLEALPLTPNGKLDRAALPAPPMAAGEAYVAPRDPEERELAAIWSRLLGVERVGVHDDFFELGGHSLLAARVVAAVREALGVELPLRALFEQPTVAELAQAVAAARNAGAAAADRIPRLPRDTDRFPVSPSQLREWLLDRLLPASGAFNIPGTTRILGPLDRRVLRLALQEIVRRHESLRTTFAEGESEPVQVVAPGLALALPLADLAALPTAAREEEVHRLSREEVAAPFDLARGPLLRARLLRLGEREHLVLFTIHHIVSDGWSMGVFFRELAALYLAFLEGRPSPLPELPIQYADYAVWQRRRLEGEALREQLDYWRWQLAGVPPLELPTDRPRPPVQRFDGAKQLFSLPRELSADLGSLAQRQGASLFMVLLAGFSALLARYSGQEDFAVGTFAAKRDRPELESLIGFFINSLVLRLRPQGEASFRRHLEQAREVALGAFAHQDVPFERLLEDLRVERDFSRPPLFQVLLVFQNFPTAAVEVSKVRLEPVPVGNDHSDFDLSLWLGEGPEGVNGYFAYGTRVFDKATIVRLGSHFEVLLRGAIADPALPLRDLPLLTAPERRQLVEWSAGPAAEPAARRVEALFAERARLSPEATAVEWEGGRLTYAELDRRSDALAGRLRDLGVGPETRVGLSLPRSPEMIVALLAVLKAGGAYLPLDPAYPQARIDFMIEDAGVVLILDETTIQAERRARRPAATIAAVDGDANHPAYVIYTSGSTGTPKGVVVEHRSLAAYTAGAVAAFGLGPDDRVLQFASISFDTSGEEIYPALASGATLVLRPDDMAASIAHFLREVERLRITVLDLPTAFWHELVMGLGTEGELPACVRLVILGGERALPERVARWRERVGPAVRLLNTYGPTEATIVATRQDLTAGSDLAPIGRPIPGASTHVLDRWDAPVPVGVAGELHVGGAGLARGYLHRPEITAERFVPDPFGSPGARLYRTGDLVRWRPSGDLEFLGRVDTQVKLRGFRVELGEIEAALRSHAEVRDAAVVLRPGPGGDPRLVAYLVTDRSDQSDRSELKAFLKQRLPEFMTPYLFVELPALPLTGSGKVDRLALPAPEPVRRDPAAGYEAPRTELERTIAEVWRELLGIERIGRHDNVFELGAHSLLIVRAHSRLRRALGRELSVVDLFRHASVGALAGYLSREEENPNFEQVKTLAQQQKAALGRQRQAMARLRKPKG
jgi:amino acid adenylation domain-containing protein